MNPTLTVFTPSYNRANLLQRGYEALLRQSSHDFCWLIIDDGSKDNTRELVYSWFAPNCTVANNQIKGVSKDATWLKIQYCYKENGGLHTGYNKAIELMDTELSVCIDSDDYMPNNGVEIILRNWAKCKRLGDDVAGIIGLDYYYDSKAPIGGKFSIENQLIKMMDLSPKYNHYGDTKIACRVDLLKEKWPMPSFKGEKNFNPFYYYLQIDNDYLFYIINENICFVDYQETGMSANIYNQYMNSPKSFACLREEYLRQTRLPFLFRFKHAIHYGSSVIFSSQISRIFHSPSPLLTIPAFPLGIMLNLFIRLKIKITQWEK